MKVDSFASRHNDSGKKDKLGQYESFIRLMQESLNRWSDLLSRISNIIAKPVVFTLFWWVNCLLFCIFQPFFLDILFQTCFFLLYFHLFGLQRKDLSFLEKFFRNLIDGIFLTNIRFGYFQISVLWPINLSLHFLLFLTFNSIILLFWFCMTNWKNHLLFIIGLLWLTLDERVDGKREDLLRRMDRFFFFVFIFVLLLGLETVLLSGGGVGRRFFALPISFVIFFLEISVLRLESLIYTW